MMWGTTEFSFGDGIGLVGHETMALVLSDDAAVRDTLWTLIAADAPLDEILEGLSGHGLRTLPSFAIARIEGERLVRVVVRGDASATLETAAGPIVVESRSVKTWLEREVEEVVAVTLDSCLAVGSATFHVLAGSVPAGRLSRSLATEDPHAALASAGWSTAAASVGVDSIPSSTLAGPPLEAPTVAVADQAVDDAAVPDAVSAPPASDEDGAFPPPAMSSAKSFDSGATLLPDDLEQIQRLSRPQPEAASAAEAAPSTPTPDDDDGYDFLFGHTVARSVHRAAVQPRDVEDHEPTVEHGLIDSIPSSDQPAAPTPAPATPQLGDHDGHTISRAELARMRAEGAIAPSGPSVQASLCTSGHPNPTHLSVCRSCGGPISPNPPVVVARPVLGVLRFSNGLVVHLDRPQLIGRSPKVEGQVGGELPNLVKLDQAGQGVSRRHVAIHLENWQVLLEDLNSANGTIVALPGRPARRLVAGEPVALEQGTVIDLGGEMSISFEVSR